MTGRPGHPSGAGAARTVRGSELSGRRALRFIFPSLVAILTLISFWPAVRHGFVNWDDAENFIGNLNYRGFQVPRLEWMLTTVHKGIYMPLTWLSYALDYHLWGMNPYGYHLVNVLWHTANAVLFYAIALQLFKGEHRWMSAALSALFFSIHPLRVESVAWVTERRDVLSGFFILLSLWYYLRAAAKEISPSDYRARLTASLIAYAVSLLCKPSGVPFPAVLLVLDRYPLERALSPQVWREKLSYLALAFPAGVMAVAAQHHVGAMTKLSSQSFVQRAAVAAYGLIFYLSKTMFPSGLSPFYRMPDVVRWSNPTFCVCGFLVCAISGILIWKRHEWRAGLAAWTAYVLLVLPVSGIFHVGQQLAADRYSYLSCMPWAFLIGAVISQLWARISSRPEESFLEDISLWVCGIGILGLLLLTRKQILYWQNSETMWSRVIERDPDCALAYTNLGTLAMSNNDATQAQIFFDKALALDPGFPFAHNNKGILDLMQGHAASAEAHFRQAIQSNPGIAESYSNLGAALYYQGQGQASFEAFQKAIERKADYADAYFNLGKLMISFKKPDDALFYFQKALSIDPGYTAIRETLANLYAANGRSDLATHQLELASLFNPSSLKK